MRQSAWEQRYSEEWRAWKDPEIPEYFNPLQVLLVKHQKTPVWSKTALSIDGKRFTYAQFYERVCRTANGLVSLELGTEDRILLFGNDSIEYLSVWLGAVTCGAVPAVISDLYKPRNLLYFLKDTAAKALFIDEEQLPKLEEIKSELPDTLKSVIVRSESGLLNRFDLAGNAKVVCHQEVVEHADSAFAPVMRHHNDISYMFYSGGTTGQAKGITHLTHDFYLVPERQGAFWQYTADDVCFATSKKYFTHGLWPGVLMPLYFGGTVVLTRQTVTPGHLVHVITTEKPTVLISVPTIVKNLLQFTQETGTKPDFSCLRMVISASEKMPPHIFDKFYDLFGLELMDSIGCSEITYEWLANRPKEFKRGSLGKPVFGFEVKLMDEEGREISEPGILGEAWVRSKTNCLFYWRKFEQTKEMFIGPWIRTADLMMFDEDGFYWFATRSNDIFKIKGMWINPIEVEAKIMEDSSVLEAAVVSGDGSDGMSEVKAYVVLRPGNQPSQELTQRIQQNVRQIGGYKVPNTIVYKEALPRTTLLKIDRNALRSKAQ